MQLAADRVLDAEFFWHQASGLRASKDADEADEYREGLRMLEEHTSVEAVRARCRAILYPAAVMAAADMSA